MADEPRRSGRATKGQTTRNAEPELPTKPNKRGRKKQKQEPEQEEEADNDVIRCLCGTEDDDERAFTQCDNCEVWQHNDCMGLPDQHDLDKYFCEQCHPEDHPRVHEALQRGESPAQIAAQLREEVAQSREQPKPKKKGRKSKGARESEVKEEPNSTPAAPELGKRKHTDTPSAPPSKVRKASTQPDGDATVREIPQQASSSTFELPQRITDVKNAGRQNTAAALKKKFAQVIKDHSSKGHFHIPDGHTSDSLGEKYGLLVEYSMFMNHCGTSPDPTPAYKDQFRNITSNVGPNPSLLWDLVEGKLTPDAFSTMSSADMATEEQKKRDKEIKEENERLAQLKDDTSRRIRRTHKGEEYVDDEIPTDSRDTAMPDPSADSPQISGENGEPTKEGTEQPKPPPIRTERSQVASQEPRMRSPQNRRSSSNTFNIQNVWSSVQSPTGEARSPSSAQAPHNNQRQAQPGAADADVDRLLDDDQDSAPYSPTEAGVDTAVVWRGKVDMPSNTGTIASFEARAQHVAGSDLGERERLSQIFPTDLILGGRIANDKADDYLTSLSAASKTDVTVLDLMTNPADTKTQEEFNKLFDYLQQRDRFGVIREPHRPPVRDVYMIPLDEGTSPIPTFLKRLDHNVLEESRPRRMLLVVFVIRYKSPPASAQATPTAAGPPTSAMSPTASGGPPGATPMRAPSQSGPRAAAQVPPPMSPQAPVNGHNQYYQPPPSNAPAPNAFPENPYAPSPPQPLQQTQPFRGPYTQPAPQPNQPYPLPEDPTQAAREELGEYYQCPTAQQMLQQAPGMTRHFLQQLRRVLEDSPESRTDFQIFTRVLRDSGGPPAGV